MGMYDSFYVNDKEYQTKQLDCVLDCYKLGDTVPNLNDMSSYSMIIGHGHHNGMLGVIIIDNVFVDYCEPDEVKDKFEEIFVMNYHKKQKLHENIMYTENCVRYYGA